MPFPRFTPNNPFHKKPKLKEERETSLAEDIYNRLAELLYDIEYRGEPLPDCYKNIKGLREALRIAKEEVKREKKEKKEKGL